MLTIFAVGAMINIQLDEGRRVKAGVLLSDFCYEIFSKTRQ